MPFSPLYSASVPVFTRGLSSLSRILAIANAHMAPQEVAPLLDARLAADMFPLSRQIQIACEHARKASARLAGVEPPRHADEEQSVAELDARIGRTLDYIGALSPDAFAATDKSLSLDLGGRVEITAERYLYAFALPNFFFHVSIAYAILRHRGAPIGKRDYLGDFAKA